MSALEECVLGVILLTIVSTFHFARADDDAEAAFGALRMKVAALKPHEPADVLDRIEKAIPHITSCPPDTPEPEFGWRAGIALEDVDYLYGRPPTSTDDTYSCYFIVNPLHRALTVDEARDFFAATMMPDILRATAGKSARAQGAARAKIGEKHFLEIRALVAAGKTNALDPETTERIIPSLGNLDALEDCSHTPVEEFVFRERNFSGGGNMSLYNDTYWWEDLDPTGPRCIYMLAPFRRGLTVEEARDFLTALQLDLGYSEEFQREMFGSAPRDVFKRTNPPGGNE